MTMRLTHTLLLRGEPHAPCQRLRPEPFSLRLIAQAVLVGMQRQRNGIGPAAICSGGTANVYKSPRTATLPARLPGRGHLPTRRR